jgi:Na+-driven multidrug efflux pump
VLFNALAGTGAAHYGGWLTTFTLAAMALLGFMLIPGLGLLGAALAQCVAAAFTLVVVATLFCRWLKMPARVLLVPVPAEWRALWAGRSAP